MSDSLAQIKKIFFGFKKGNVIQIIKAEPPHEDSSIGEFYFLNDKAVIKQVNTKDLECNFSNMSNEKVIMHGNWYVNKHVAKIIKRGHRD